jgi:hypothetical protein
LNNFSIIQKAISGVIFLVSSSVTIHAQQSENLAEKFLRLLNKFDRDSLSMIISKDFVLQEPYADIEWTRTGFLDTFVVQSKLINGTFQVVEITAKNKTSTTFLVDDRSDYMTYLRPSNLRWKLTLTIQHNLISSMTSDTTTGYKSYLDDFIRKHDAFEAWLKINHPDEDEAMLLYNNKITARLIEYANKKDQ